MISGDRLGGLIRQARNARGWTLAELGKRCGIKRAQMSKIEQEATHASLDVFLKICHAFGLEAVKGLQEKGAQKAGSPYEVDYQGQPHDTEVLRTSDNAHQLGDIWYTVLGLTEIAESEKPRSNTRIIDILIQELQSSQAGQLLGTRSAVQSYLSDKPGTKADVHTISGIISERPEDVEQACNDLVQNGVLVKLESDETKRTLFQLVLKEGG